MKHTIHFFLRLFLAVLLVSCGGGGTGSSQTTTPLSSTKSITNFSLAGYPGTINETNKTIAVNMPSSINESSLIATFTSTGISVSVGTTAQISNSTANDFTGPVNYTVTAADSTTVIYTVTVTLVPPSTIGGTSSISSRSCPA